MLNAMLAFPVVGIRKHWKPTFTKQRLPHCATCYLQSCFCWLDIPKIQSNENDLVNTAKVSFKERYELKYTCTPLCSENSPGRLIHKDVNLAMTDSRSKRETPNPYILFSVCSYYHCQTNKNHKVCQRNTMQIKI